MATSLGEQLRRLKELFHRLLFRQRREATHLKELPRFEVAMKSGPTRRQIALASLVAISILIATVTGSDDEPAAPAPVATAPEATELPENEPPPVPRSALERLKDSAEAGDAKDQLLLAVKYSTANGVVKDQAEASRWYLMTAKGGDPQSMYEVSMRYRNGHGFTRSEANAHLWRQRAASAGVVQAQYEMAHTYGTVTNKGALIAQQKDTDPGESSRQLVMWLTRASEFGSAVAKHELALVRLFGISRGGADRKGYLLPLPSVTASAIQLLTENAEAGYWESQHALAELHQAGYADVKPNLSESSKWWQRLEAQTDASVQMSIGRHYLAPDVSQYSAGSNKWKGKPLSHEDTNQVAFEWFNRAAAQGHANALWQLATMEYGGVGTSQDLERALQHHRKAAELGQVDAMYHLGLAYSNGKGVSKDYASALHWLGKAVAYEDLYGSNPVRSQAQSALGVLYEYGNGVGIDLLIAYAWYNLAAVSGDQKANENLSRVEKLLKPDELTEAQALSSNWKPGSPITRPTSNAAS